MLTTLMAPPANLGELPHFGETLRRRNGSDLIEVHSLCFARSVLVCCDGRVINFDTLDEWLNVSRPPIEWTTFSSDRFP